LVLFRLNGPTPACPPPQKAIYFFWCIILLKTLAACRLLQSFCPCLRPCFQVLVFPQFKFVCESPRGGNFRNVSFFPPPQIFFLISFPLKRLPRFRVLASFTFLVQVSVPFIGPALTLFQPAFSQGSFFCAHPLLSF